jgi:hypothetical protein
MVSKSVYLPCKKERSQARKNLIFCLSNCADRCDAFLALPEPTILEAIEADQGRHPIHYDQLKLFPVKRGSARR